MAIVTFTVRCKSTLSLSLSRQPLLVLTFNDPHYFGLGRVRFYNVVLKHTDIVYVDSVLNVGEIQNQRGAHLVPVADSILNLVFHGAGVKQTREGQGVPGAQRGGTFRDRDECLIGAVP